ncbi:hypothetical protein GIB67_037410 [Kingdonia uniflora]|uniref:Uncharacterized protein n=1 Tax=Kingdonia uniflora TaxID=39325 RepID=A0A7J7M8N6_9MAGN|nr:hypothetical protein GIB67_037410 [Kingdonia uniflora]
MERDEATTSSGFNNGGRIERGGAGGKFRKPYTRKPPLTPYSRPPNPNHQSDSNSWFSTATRLISGGATKLLPYFFSPSKPLIHAHVENQEVNQDASDEEQQHISDIQIGQSVDARQVPEEAKMPTLGPFMGKLSADNDSYLSQIEQMMKEKTFSKDDLNRLTEVLRSRIADQADVVGQAKETINVITGTETPSGLLGEGNLKAFSAEKGKAVHLSRVSGGAVPFVQTSIQDQICASPIEIAKAYMGGRTSDSGLGFRNQVSWDEKTPLPVNEFTLKPSNPPSSPICWPGSMVHDQRPYLTPQTQKDRRIGLHNLPRTPYSRAIGSRSTSKLQGGVDRSLDILSSHSKRSQPPTYGDSQVMTTGSVGPVRRVRRSFGRTSPSYGASSSYNASKGPSSIFQQDLDPGASSSRSMTFTPSDIKAPSSSVAVSGVHPQSSHTARKILEHLDRTLPTTQRKSAEIKLGTSWRRSPSSSQRPKVQLDQRIEMAADAVNTNSSISNTLAYGDGLCLNTKTPDFQVNAHEAPARPSENSQIGKNQESNNQIDGNMDVSRRMQNSSSEAPKSEKKLAVTRGFGSKSALTSIQVLKPDPRRTFTAFDNGSGFTFPISASSGTLSEPPTPSIMPSFSASGQSQAQNKATVPVFSFGSKTAGNNSIVFSFPSTSSSTPVDTTDPKFSFGSEKKRDRISFAAVGKDAFCY